MSLGNVIRVLGIHLAERITQFPNLILSLCSCTTGSHKNAYFYNIESTHLPRTQPNEHIIKFVRLMPELGNDVVLLNSHVALIMVIAKLYLILPSFNTRFLASKIIYWHLFVFGKLKYIIWSNCSVCQSALMSNGLWMWNETLRLFIPFGDIYLNATYLRCFSYETCGMLM